MMKKTIAMALLFTMTVLASCSNIKEYDDNVEKNHQQTIADDQSSSVEAAEKFYLVDKALEKSDAFGGDSYLLNRKYDDETYNLAYLGKLYEGELSILPDGALERWIESVFLNQSTEEQEALPTIYQAIQDLGISQESLTALNDSRKKLGSYMILSDDFIASLYIEDMAEMKKSLVNPLALYYDGEVYTWADLRDERMKTVITEKLPSNVLEEYVDHVADYFCNEGILEYDILNQVEL